MQREKKIWHIVEEEDMDEESMETPEFEEAETPEYEAQEEALAPKGLMARG